MLDEYRHAADALLLGARMAAAKMVHADAYTDDLIDLFEAVERTSERRLASQLGVRDEEALVSLGGILGAHAVHARLLFAGEDDLAELVGRHLPTLWSDDLHARLGVARELALVQASGPGMRELAAVFRRGPGSELVNASGQLARRVATDGGAVLGEAWYGVFGTYVLVAGRAVRPAATNMVRTGREKIRVAERAGISRVTLDKWLGAGTGGMTKRPPRRGGSAGAELSTQEETVRLQGGPE